MPRQRNTENPSIPTIQRWLETYLTALDKAIEDGRCGEEKGREACQHLALSIQALDDQRKDYRVKGALERQEARKKYLPTATTASIEPQAREEKDDDYYSKLAILTVVEGEDGRVLASEVADVLETDEDEILRLARAYDKLAVKKTKSGDRVICLV